MQVRLQHRHAAARGVGCKQWHSPRASKEACRGPGTRLWGLGPPPSPASPAWQRGRKELSIGCLGGSVRRVLCACTGFTNFGGCRRGHSPRGKTTHHSAGLAKPYQTHGHSQWPPGRTSRGFKSTAGTLPAVQQAPSARPPQETAQAPAAAVDRSNNVLPINSCMVTGRYVIREWAALDSTIQSSSGEGAQRRLGGPPTEPIRLGKPC